MQSDMANNAPMIAAGFSGMLGMQIASETQKYQLGNPRRIEIEELFGLTTYFRPFLPPPVDPSGITIHVQDLVTKRKTSFIISPSSTVADLKQCIQQLLPCANSIWQKVQVALYNHQLQELLDGYSLSYYGIETQSVLYSRFLPLAKESFYLPDDCLAPEYNFDFSKLQDDGQVYWRGLYHYYRPYGWNRIAVKVKGKYENDIWLGENGLRTHPTPGEWPVSYHGTKINAACKIVEEGFNNDYLERSFYGPGHYSTPYVNVAEGFADEFEYCGKKYKVVLQTRVNMDCTSQHVHFNNDIYLRTSNPSALRPYGMLFKEIRP